MSRKKFLYDRLRERRDALGLSQAELARRANVSKHDVENAEAGRVKNPKYTFMVNVAAVLQDNPDSFFESDVVDIRHEGGPSTDGTAA